jgi:hypothetical protein
VARKERPLCANKIERPFFILKPHRNTGYNRKEICTSPAILTHDTYVCSGTEEYLHKVAADDWQFSYGITPRCLDSSLLCINVHSHSISTSLVISYPSFALKQYLRQNPTSTRHALFYHNGIVLFKIATGEGYRRDGPTHQSTDEST